MAECFYLTDPKDPSARDIYCPDCADRASDDPQVHELFERGDADNGESCVICDRVVDGAAFVFPDCYNCGGECRDVANGDFALWVKFGQPQADPFYICGTCFHDEGKERGVI